MTAPQCSASRPCLTGAYYADKNQAEQDARQEAEINARLQAMPSVKGGWLPDDFPTPVELPVRVPARVDQDSVFSRRK